MMEQPYIFKKQILSLVFFSLIFIFLKCIDNNSIWIAPAFFYSIQIAAITFVPSLRKKVKYPLFLHTILYYSALFLPLIIVNIDIGSPQNLTGIIIGIAVSLLLHLSNYKHTKKYISSENYAIYRKTDLKEFIYNIFTNVYAVVGEEFFYRYFLIGFLDKHMGVYAVLLSAAIFVYSHYINRWANINFSLRSYVYHGLTGIAFGLIFFYTKSISACIIAHLIFNGPEFIVIYKRYTNSKKQTDVLFDDYD